MFVHFVEFVRKSFYHNFIILNIVEYGWRN